MSTLYDPQELYQCSECPKAYRGNWIQRHLVKEHGYMWWDNERVMKPDFYSPKVAPRSITEQLKARRAASTDATPDQQGEQTP